jgi:hypothetical protein
MAPGQDQQPGIICQQSAAAAALFVAPADEGITIPEVKGRRTPGGYRQPLTLVEERIAQMLSHQSRVVKVMMLEDRLIASRDLLRATQQPELAMFEDVLFVVGNVEAFDFAQSGSVKKCGMNVPNKVLSHSAPSLSQSERTLPTGKGRDCACAATRGEPSRSSPAPRP